MVSDDEQRQLQSSEGAWREACNAGGADQMLWFPLGRPRYANQLTQHQRYRLSGAGWNAGGLPADSA